MAKASLDRDLFNKLRSSGLRKRTARAIAEAGENSSKLVRGTVDELRSLADQIESRVRGRDGRSSSRSAAAKKAAATRKRNAAKRSTAAKKAANTRAKSGSSSSSRSGGSARKKTSGSRSS